MRLKSRFWELFASSPTLSADGPVDLTRETTEQEKSGEFVMVAFSGAHDADVCSAWRTASLRRRYVKALKAPYPTISREMDRETACGSGRCITGVTAGQLSTPEAIFVRTSETVIST